MEAHGSPPLPELPDRDQVLAGAYGLYYLNNRPALLQLTEGAGGTLRRDTLVALSVRAPDAASVAAAVAGRRQGTALPVFVAGARDDALPPPLAFVTSAQQAGAFSALALPPPAARGPFTASYLAAALAMSATESQPATILGLDSLLDTVVAVARGVKGYAVRPPLDRPDHAFRALQEWLGEHDEEVAASVEVKDAIALLVYRPYAGAGATRDPSTWAGAHGALAAAGYNPHVVDLEAQTDESVRAFVAAVFPCGGFADMENYGKLVVFTLDAGTLITYPQPITRDDAGTPLNTSFLWPLRVAPPRPVDRLLRRPLPDVLYRAQVRDGTSTLMSARAARDYGTARYFRLSAARRRELRRTLLGLLEGVAPRQVAPDDALDVEAVARLSPDGGALLFVANRLGRQRGTIALPEPSLLNLAPPVRATVEYSARGSAAQAVDGGVAVDLQAGDALIVRLR